MEGVHVVGTGPGDLGNFRPVAELGQYILETHNSKNFRRFNGGGFEPLRP